MCSRCGSRVNPIVAETNYSLLGDKMYVTNINPLDAPSFFLHRVTFYFLLAKLQFQCIPPRSWMCLCLQKSCQYICSKWLSRPQCTYTLIYNRLWKTVRNVVCQIFVIRCLHLILKHFQRTVHEIGLSYKFGDAHVKGIFTYLNWGNTQGVIGYYIMYYIICIQFHKRNMYTFIYTHTFVQMDVFVYALCSWKAHPMLLLC